MTTLDISTLDAEVAALKARIDAATRHRIRAEQQRDTAQAQADMIRNQLKAQFNVDTEDEALDLLNRIETELQAAVTQLRQLLDETGA